MVLHQATLLRTQDPDRADTLVKVPQAIINAQKVTAENEFDTIERRAALGQVLPVADDDIHQDHVPVHLLDMQAMVARHEMRPWDKYDGERQGGDGCVQGDLWRASHASPCF